MNFWSHALLIALNEMLNSSKIWVPLSRIYQFKGGKCVAASISENVKFSTKVLVNRIEHRLIFCKKVLLKLFRERLTTHDGSYARHDYLTIDVFLHFVNFFLTSIRWVQINRISEAFNLSLPSFSVKMLLLNFLRNIRLQYANQHEQNYSMQQGKHKSRTWINIGEESVEELQGQLQVQVQDIKWKVVWKQALNQTKMLYYCQQIPILRERIYCFWAVTATKVYCISWWHSTNN